MCRTCVKEALPQRQRTCLEGGAYLLNWNACAQCGSKSAPVAREHEVKEEAAEDPEEAAQGVLEEETTFKHVCGECEHVVCEHYHKFAVVSVLQQEYLMECVLCGRGADEVALDRSGSLGGAALPAAAIATAPAASEDPEAAARSRESLMNGLAEQMSVLGVLSASAAEAEDSDGSAGWDA